MLDLNFWIVNSLIWLAVSLISFVNNLPTLMLQSLQDCWSVMLFWMLTASEGVVTAAQTAAGSCLQLLGGVSESFKMAGHLSSYVLARVKELLQRGVLSGHCLLRQFWEGCGIALSLILYLVNTVKTAELAVALLTFVHSSLLGTTVLLWTPCQLALEFLCSLSHVFVSVFLLNAYGVVVTMTIVAAATLYLNADLTLQGVHRARGYVSHAPVLCRLRRALCRLSPLALERARTARVEMGVWLRRRGGGGLLRRGTLQGAAAAAMTSGRRRRARSEDLPQAGALLQGAAGRRTLLSLLKEQEERKKCVICQDKSKTVLLLPCRHLCLCRDCASLLLRQPIYRHNCPLCRRIIIQTMDVYL
ncbi:hypothetical protein AAFF_G00440600 [Aldrovandia affinis]|uniref:E3 ubiquitin-protein ligase RNF26 n=1 Tax=Aldrovandia affinis TaxID=143900 RepID=A0AAD7WHH2_9TELE|nr:hypothetical protein AAFF_G00440600 [Aldrovandia affinis]